MNYIGNTFKEINDFTANYIIPKNKISQTALIVGLVALTILGSAAITLTGGLLLGCLFSPPAIVVAASLIYVAAKEKHEEKNLDKMPKETILGHTEKANSSPLFFIDIPSTLQENDPQELRVNLQPGDPLIALREQALKGTFNYTPTYE